MRGVQLARSQRLVRVGLDPSSGPDGPHPLPRGERAISGLSMKAVSDP